MEESQHGHLSEAYPAAFTENGTAKLRRRVKLSLTLLQSIANTASDGPLKFKWHLAETRLDAPTPSYEVYESDEEEEEEQEQAQKKRPAPAASDEKDQKEPRSKKSKK
jgi:hypothetical protein